MLNKVQTSLGRCITDRKIMFTEGNSRIFFHYNLCLLAKRAYIISETHEISILYNFYFLNVKDLSILVTFSRAIKWHPSLLAHRGITHRRQEYLK